MEERSIEKMVMVSLTVKGEMKDYLTALGSRTNNNLNTWAKIRRTSHNGCGTNMVSKQNIAKLITDEA